MSRDTILAIFAASIVLFATSLGAFVVAAFTAEDLWFGFGLLILLGSTLLLLAALRLGEDSRE